MSNLGSTLVKLVALAGGAIAGALLSRWYDEVMMERAERADERSERDKTRYAQGLSPIGDQGQGQGQQPR